MASKINGAPGNSDVPIFILAGGLGTRLKELTEAIPKPMVTVGQKPIIWHIMRKYAKHGFNKFVICTGFKSEVVKDYFLSYHSRNSDFTVELLTDGVTYHGTHHEEDWKVTVTFTGELTMTGGRIAKAARKYLGDSEYFGVTYGDGVTDVDLDKEFSFHKAHAKIGTLLAINPPSRFGELKRIGSTITGFEEKPELSNSWINGGYFFFRREFVDYLTEEEDLVLEQQPLQSLAKNGELEAFEHSGFWSCMDTQRDRDQLERLWSSGQARWI